MYSLEDEVTWQEECDSAIQPARVAKQEKGKAEPDVWDKLLCQDVINHRLVL